VKIKKSELKKLIKEELEATLEEAPSFLSRLFGDKDSSKGSTYTPRYADDESSSDSGDDEEERKCAALNRKFDGEYYFFRDGRCAPCPRGYNFHGKNALGEPDCRGGSSSGSGRQKYSSGEGGYGGFSGYSESQIKEIVKEAIQELYPDDGDKQKE
tara:strand:+ start:561 stop:1028 length:468 start_codon:yes stop_codon:yes gene_type:complete